YLHLKGRLKEMINRGGENISPHEDEAVLVAHPLVAEAVAFSVPDPKYGERVAGAIGGYVGAALARSGSDVTLIARGEHLRAMQSGGVRIESPQGDFTSQVAATS